MVVTCTIEFDNNATGTYFAGQVVTGKITLQSDKPKQVKGVLLKIDGFAHTNWTERYTVSHNDLKGNTTTTSNSTYFSGHEDYIASLTYLLGSDENQSSIIAPGIHTYNYACHIPSNCPSSYEGVHGHIRYTVKVVLIRPWKFDQTYTKGFTVLKVMDLNYDSPLLRMPSDTEVQQTFCCAPCESKPLRIHVNLPRSGYVPGENIPVNVLVTNDSKVLIEEVNLHLSMMVVYYSQQPYTNTKHQTITVTRFKGDPVPRNCKKLFNYLLPVPATPPTCFNLCRLLQVAYQVVVVCKVKGWHTDQKLSVPVTIGNVPLMGVIQQQPSNNAGWQRDFMGAVANGEAVGMQAADVEVVPAENAAPQALNADNPWSADANIPPPTYAQATHTPIAKINAGEAHDYGQSEFRPSYPVFNIPSATAPMVVDDTDGGFVNNNVNGDKSTWL